MNRFSCCNVMFLMVWFQFLFTSSTFPLGFFTLRILFYLFLFRILVFCVIFICLFICGSSFASIWWVCVCVGVCDVLLAPSHHHYYPRKYLRLIAELSPFDSLRSVRAAVNRQTKFQGRRSIRRRRRISSIWWWWLWLGMFLWKGSFSFSYPCLFIYIFVFLCFFAHYSI